MRAHILSIGDELLGGYITDTNSTFLAQQLALLNIELTLVTHVGDNRDRIAEIIQRGVDEADIVICTGGVGPTEDDLTREAIAQVVGETPVVDPDLLITIKAFFAGRGLEMPERNAKQAWVIPSNETLPNPVGTAPGWFVRAGNSVIAALPGVPREMFRMWADQLQPRLAAMQSGAVIRSTTLKTIGIGESLVEQNLHALILRADPIIATYAKDDGVHIRVTATRSDATSAEAVRDACVDEITAIIGGFIYGRDDETLARILVQSLSALDFTLAIADNGGAGRFASMLATDPTAAKVIEGTVMSLHEPKTTAEGSARWILEETGADLGVGIIVKTTEDAPGVFAATVEIAVEGTRTARKSFPIRSGYEDVQRRSALLVAEVLRSALISD